MSGTPHACAHVHAPGRSACGHDHGGASLAPAGAEELRRIRLGLAAAQTFVGRYAPDEPANLTGLERALRGWAREEDPLEPFGDVVALTAAALGASLCTGLPLQWAVFDDGHERALAVHGSRGELLLFPHRFVEQRLREGHRAFLSEVVTEIAEALAASAP